MPVLNWIGKSAVVKHHQDVPYRLLEPVPGLSCGDTDSGNLIVQGDNLLALKALLPRYAGQVKCIYIDPPYNTGNEGWVYNDNVNSPEIRRWLGEVVGKEGETLDRHDRWLCMMYPRLVLLRQFLRDDGVTQSETAVEQLLGRVLRQPGAKARKTTELNQSYAFVMSSDFTSAASALRDRLVAGAGFERKAAEDFVRAGKQEQTRFDLSARPGRIVVTPVVVPLAETPQIRHLPKPLRDKLEWDKKTKQLTIHQPLTEEETGQLAAAASNDAERNAIAQAGEVSRTTAVEVRLSPAAMGEVLSVPAMALWMQGELQFFDDPEVLDYPFDLSGYDAYPNLGDLQAMGLADRVASGGTIDVTDEGRMSVGFIANLERDLGFSYKPEHWDEVRLSAWLCRNLPDAGITHSSKWAFVQKWLQTLLQKPDCGLARANRQKFLIRNLLEARIRELQREAVKQAYQKTLFGDDKHERVKVGGEFQVVFDPQAYAPNADYDDRYGIYDFQHHYYGRIGNFDSKEEFECACWLDQQAATGRIKYWVRNLVNKQGCSFFLQKATGRFWPDFVCEFPNGKILVVEYKGAQGWTDAEDDRQIGGLWAEMSDGHCRFVMVRDRQWQQIDDKLR